MARSPSGGADERATRDAAPSSDAGSPTQTTPGGGRSAGPDTPSLAPETVLAGRFRIVRYLARGGMGEVYEARDLELREEVALKTVRAEIAGDPQALERFRNEIHLARKVTHPNACRIFDVFHHRSDADHDTVFLTMELLRGETLDARLRRTGRLTPAATLPLAEQMGAALEAAHRAGVIHRDFKTGNVILVAEPGGGERAVVTDFGLARRAAGVEASLSGSGESRTEYAVGTPAYMAPEQVEGGPLSPATDVYAFGVVLFELLTGARPFAGDTPIEIMLKRLREAPASPRSLVRDLDPRWEAVVLRCLERDPADRFAGAGDVLRALRGEPVARGRSARRRRLAGRWRCWRWRRPGGPGARQASLPRPRHPRRPRWRPPRCPPAARWPCWPSATWRAGPRRPGFPPRWPRCSRPSWPPVRA